MIKKNNDVLVSQKKVLTSYWSHFLGLQFHLPIKDTGYIFQFTKERNADIHMLFVFFPIDVLWLNKKREVIALQKKMLPFISFAAPGVKAQYVIELPSGTIERKNVLIGDILEFFPE